MRQRIGGVGKLGDEKGARDFAGEARGDVLIVFRVTLAHVRARETHIDAEAAQVLDFLARHLVGHHQHKAIAFEDADLGEPEPGIARSSFHDHAAGLQPPVLFRRLDHGQRRSGP